jgi:hypothetical protein
MLLYIGSGNEMNYLLIIPLNTSTERTEVFHGEENVVDVVLHFTSRAKGKIDACVDNTRSLLAIEIEELRKSFIDAKTRGVRLRYVTEITKDNINHCKQLIKIINELRHIDGINNFYISETEYIAPATLHEKRKPFRYFGNSYYYLLLTLDLNHVVHCQFFLLHHVTTCRNPV